MAKNEFDIIVIGAGSAGLSIGLFMSRAGFKVLMVSSSDHNIGGDCLNDGCVPSKAIIHVAKIVQQAKEASQFGLEIKGKVDINKVTAYIRSKQSNIRKHENAAWLKDQGVAVALGLAKFTRKREVQVGKELYTAKKIVIATGSKPTKLKINGIEMVNYFDNKSIFNLETLPERMVCIGGGPIGIEMAHALSRLGSKVTVIHQGKSILEHDDISVTDILLEQLKKEGIDFLLEAEVDRFNSATEGVIKLKSGKSKTIEFDAVFVAIGRELSLEPLHLEKANIDVKDGKIVRDPYLRTTNKDVLVCGDIVGDLQFSHAAEAHARLILNNLFSPFKKKLDNQYMSWVTFTEPQLATFGLSEKQLKDKNISYRRLEKDFKEDDRAVVDGYTYGKLVVFVSKAGFLKKQKFLGGTMVAPNAGELIQELILANTNKLSVKTIFTKIYPYPVETRINQAVITDLMSEGLTPFIKSFLQKAYRIFN